MSSHSNGISDDKKARWFLSPEKKFQIFLETQRVDVPASEVLRREGLYSTDLARIRQKVKEEALERLADQPMAKKKMVSLEQYETLKQELEEKERVLAEMALEVAILRKKRMGVSGSDKRVLAGIGAKTRDCIHHGPGKGDRALRKSNVPDVGD